LSQDSQAPSEEQGVDDAHKAAMANPPMVVTSLAHGSRRRAWTRPWRHGLHSDTWLAILEKLAPTKTVLVTGMQWQVGLLMAALRFNDRRFGLQTCQLVAFLDSLVHANGSENRTVAFMRATMRTASKQAESSQ
jgi:hypothetical protein